MADTIILSADANPAIRELDRLSKRLDTLSNEFKDKFGKMADHAKTLGAALVATGVAVAAYADDISDIASANSVAIEQVLGLSKALVANGGKAENVGKMFQTMSNKIEEANGGNLKSLNTFNRLGVSIGELGRLSNTELKDKLLANLAAIKDPIERNALAMDIFGKSLVGVDIEKFAAAQKQAVEDMRPYAGAIETAGAAWDNIVGILGKIKLAFAEAFQPIFWLLSKLPFSIDAAVVGFRLLGIGVALVAAPAVLAGFASLINLVKTLTVVAARNPFVAIATALLAIGPSIASYFGIMKDSGDQQDKNNAKTQQGTRNQEGLNEALKKEQTSLREIGKALDDNLTKAAAKFNLEYQTIGLSQEQKKIVEERARIEQEAQDALNKLKEKYNAMDGDSRKRNAGLYNEEKNGILARAAAEKIAIEGGITAVEQKKSSYDDLKKTFEITNTAQDDLLKNELKYKIAGQARSNSTITLENQINAVLKERSAIAEKINTMGVTDQLNISQALERATIKVSDQIGKVDDLQMAFQEAFLAESQGLNISKEARQKVFEGLSSQRLAIKGSTQAVIDFEQRSLAASRTFSAGWSKSFNEYVDAATNAADKATKIFSALSQSLEDSLFRFFTTGKFGWKQFADDIIKEMIRIETKQLAMNILTGGSGRAGKSGSGLLGLGGLFGFLADGGPASANKPYIVGERGPELFVPNSSGTVIPNGALGGQAVTYNINAVDANSFKQMLAADPTFLHAVAEQGRRRLPGAR